jgi:murein DD-endopeptidase MepM/ murein hydrolase activator NlpD
MSNRSHDDPARGRGLRRALAFGLLAGAAGCASSPQYPIHMGERAGDGTIMAAQPRYAVSAQDAAQNDADRRAQAGYPAYNAPPVGDPASPPPAVEAPAAPATDMAAGMADDTADDAPKPPPPSGGAVDSADLPPPGAAGAPGVAGASGAPASGPAPDAADVPPADPAATPHEISYAYGGGQVVFGMDWVVARPLELAAYRHRRHAAATEPASASSNSVGDATADTSDKPKGRRHRGKAAPDSGDAAPTTPARAAGDTPYQTVVKPGETLAEVAERTHSSKTALVDLNDLKHPRHIKPGTVLKIPYRYSYEVQKGDTLYTIAHRFDQEPATIAKLNGMKAVPTLQPGQTLQLPPDAADQGKRDHASAAGPQPVAAPEKLAAAALRKAERHDRRSRAAELNTAEASLPPQDLRHGRRRRAETAETAEAGAGAPAGGAETAAAAPPPLAAPRPRVAAPTAEEGAAARPAVVASAPPTPAPHPYVAPPLAAATAAPLSAPTSTLATSRAAAPRVAAGAMAPGPVASSSGVSTGAAAPLRSSAPAPSTYVSPGYAARSPSPAAGQYASVSPPRYPAPGTGSAAPYTPSLGRERPTAPALSGGAASSSDIALAARGRFIWPLRGPVVSAFGAKGTGEYNNGVDISAPTGTSVRAAAAGDVVYAGSSIPGYGNMVLIKHPGGWVTAYAHLNRIEVRMHDTVSQGDEIGQAGQTGVADRPELYFEVRYAASAADRPRPVDPALVLPAGGG